MFQHMIGIGVNCVFGFNNLGCSFAQVPEYLNSNPNFLQFPTKPEEVKVQGTQPITLAQALELARRNNLDLQVALSKVELSRASLREVQADMYPNISLNADLSRTQSSFNQLFGEQSGEQAQLSSTQISRFGQNEPTTTFSSGLQLEYGLYNFKKGGSSRKAAEEKVLVDELDVERRSEDLRLNVTNGYYNLQLADEQVRIYQASVLNYEASLRDAQALERSGVGTRFDVLQAQVNLANAQQQLTNAFAQQRIVRRQFAVLLSLPQSVDISAADPVQLAGLWNQTLEESIVLAFQNCPELQQRLAERTIAQLGQKIELSNLNPVVSFVASYHLEDVFNDKLLDDENFANFFLGNKNLGLVILNTCKGATVSANQAFAGTAPNLVRRGIPAVIAMQYTIPDLTAKLFADEFYRTLAQGYPVDTVIQTTRNAISMEVGLEQCDFATPVLYMRAKDGIILSRL